MAIGITFKKSNLRMDSEISKIEIENAIAATKNGSSIILKLTITLIISGQKIPINTSHDCFEKKPEFFIEKN
jgi:hypothetical protein